MENLISAADNAERNQSYSYSNANELTEVTDAKNESYLYNYTPANDHRLQSVILPQQQIEYVFEHDSYVAQIIDDLNVVYSYDTSLDFGDTWIISYTLYADYRERIQFYGKASV